jgi:anti-anti-sigma regulatory factor
MVRILTRSRVNGGDAVIAQVNSSLKKLFDITKMHEVFAIYPTIEDATNHFNQ